MKLYFNNISWLFLRPWLGVSFGVWVGVSIAYYWWLLSRISVLENQNKVFKTHLRMSERSVRTINLDKNAVTYQVPVIPDASGTLCETIHVVLVCMGKCTRQVTPMLKSLLQHRQNPIHFHFVVDSSAQHIMERLFDTWDIPDVQYTCYNAQPYLTQVRWIPNSHYSGIYALVKLLLPEILPKHMEKVLLLDSDLTFLSDVAELWAIFENMTDEQLIGLVENESNWYLDSEKHWPAVGRGFNSGVMLLRLRAMRNANWSVLWRQAVTDNIERYKQTTLADQDVINAVIKDNPSIIHNVSCRFNVQMSTKTLAKACYGEDVNNVMIVHWNSPNKYSIHIRDSEVFRAAHLAAAAFDGGLLREKLHRCSQKETVTYKMNHSDLCLSFRAAQRVKLRTHLYYAEFSYRSESSFDVTLVVQLSMDRIQFLHRLASHWEGPLSAAIYLADCEVPSLESFIREWSDTLSVRTNIGYHLVFKNSDVHYPVNYLRNVALENVVTPYVFLMDVDFVPMDGLYEHLKRVTQLINPYPQKKCLVVPAFETARYRASPPRSKIALLSRLKSDVAPFRAREWPKGHRATDYKRWNTAEKPYEVEWQSDYEPYLVVHRSVPKYDTRFSGFGWNKVSHGVELRALGWRLLVLPGAFVVHTPHAPSKDISAFRADAHYRICLALLKQEFIDDLKRRYNVTFEEKQDHVNPDKEEAPNEGPDKVPNNVPVLQKENSVK